MSNDGRPRCQKCGRVLVSPKSIAAGYGPICGGFTSGRNKKPRNLERGAPKSFPLLELPPAPPWWLKYYEGPQPIDDGIDPIKYPEHFPEIWGYNSPLNFNMWYACNILIPGLRNDTQGVFKMRHSEHTVNNSDWIKGLIQGYFWNKDEQICKFGQKMIDIIDDYTSFFNPFNVDFLITAVENRVNYMYERSKKKGLWD